MAPAPTVHPSASLQAQRRARILGDFMEGRRGLFGEAGEWKGDAEDAPPRIGEKASYVVPFLASGTPEGRRQADAIVENLRFEPCKFTPLILAQALVEFPSVLSEKAIARSLAYLSDSAKDEIGPDCDFVGVNDNFPSVSTAFLALYARLSPAAEASSLDGVVRARFTRFRDQLERRGLATELNSPTYTPLTLHALALAATWAKEEESRSLAAWCEGRVWEDLLAHWHPPTGQVAGPHSRAYAWDLEGPGLVRTLMVQVLGEVVGDPWGFCYKETREAAEASAALRACVDYHCPPDHETRALAKRFPYLLVASSEGAGSRNDLPADAPSEPLPFGHRSGDESNLTAAFEYPAYECLATTWMTEDLTLGTLTVPFHSGQQSESFLATWALSPEQFLREGDRSLPGCGKIYARVLVDGEFEPDLKRYRSLGRHPSLVPNAGRIHALQHRGAALVVTKPYGFFHAGLRSVETALVIPNVFEDEAKGLSRSPRVPLDEIRIGGNPVDVDGLRSGGETLPFAASDDFALHSGNALFRFLPALPPPPDVLAEGRRLILRRHRSHLLVSWVHASFERRAVPLKTLLRLGGGFVCETGSLARSKSLGDFLASLSSARLQDGWERHVHGRDTALRVLRYEREGLRFDLATAPVSEGFRYRAVNGEAQVVRRWVEESA